MSGEMWSELEPVLGAASKRPDLRSAEAQPTRQPMRANIKPAEQKRPTGDQRKFRRQMQRRAEINDIDLTCPVCGNHDPDGFVDDQDRYQHGHDSVECKDCGTHFSPDTGTETGDYLGPKNSSSTPTKESTMTAQPNDTRETLAAREASLRTRLASANTLMEQAALSAQLDEVYSAQRQVSAAHGEFDWGGLDIPTDHNSLATHAREYVGRTASAPEVPADVHLSAAQVTAQSDWLDDILPTEINDSVMTANMRAQATLWYEDGVYAPVKESRQEFSVQAHNAALRAGAEYGLSSTAAASVFLAQVDHLHKKAGHTAAGTSIEDSGYLTNQRDVEATPSQEYWRGVVDGEAAASNPNQMAAQTPEWIARQTPQYQQGRSDGMAGKAPKSGRAHTSDIDPQVKKRIDDAAELGRENWERRMDEDEGVGDLPHNRKMVSSAPVVGPGTWDEQQKRINDAADQGRRDWEKRLDEDEGVGDLPHNRKMVSRQHTADATDSTSWGHNEMGKAEPNATTDTYVSDGKTTQPVGTSPSEVKKFDEHTLPGADGNATSDPKTSPDAGVQQSLKDGTTPQGDASQSVENPLTDQQGLDHSKQTGEFGDDALPTGGSGGNAATGSVYAAAGNCTACLGSGRTPDGARKCPDCNGTGKAGRSKSAAAATGAIEALFGRDTRGIETHSSAQSDAAFFAEAAKSGSNVVWSPEKGWHDGEEVEVGLDEKGRFTTKPKQEKSSSIHSMLADDWGMTSTAIGGDDTDSSNGLGVGIDEGSTPEGDHSESTVQETPSGDLDKSQDRWDGDYLSTGGEGNAASTLSQSPYSASLSANGQVFVAALSRMASLDETMQGISGRQIAAHLLTEPNLPDSLKEALRGGGNPFVRSAGRKGAKTCSTYPEGETDEDGADEPYCEGHTHWSDERGSGTAHEMSNGLYRLHDENGDYVDTAEGGWDGNGKRTYSSKTAARTFYSHGCEMCGNEWSNTKDSDSCSHCGAAAEMVDSQKKTSSKTADNGRDEKGYSPCPNHPGQSYNTSTGDCSCGSNHKRWANSNNPGGMKSSSKQAARQVIVVPLTGSSHNITRDCSVGGCDGRATFAVRLPENVGKGPDDDVYACDSHVGDTAGNIAKKGAKAKEPVATGFNATPIFADSPGLERMRREQEEEEAKAKSTASKTGSKVEKCSRCGTTWTGGRAEHKDICPKCGHNNATGHTPKVRPDGEHNSSLSVDLSTIASGMATVADGEGPTWVKPCPRCGTSVERWRGEQNVSCPNCDAQFNASGQQLRDDWRNNASNYDDEIGDMEGYEDSFHDASRKAMNRLATGDYSVGSVWIYTGKGEFFSGLTTGARVQVTAPSIAPGRIEVTLADRPAPSISVDTSDLAPAEGFTASRTTADYSRNPQGNPDLGWVDPPVKSPSQIEKERLFPNGIPLRGDLTPEQQAWLKRRD